MKSIGEIREEFQKASEEECLNLCELYKDDTRKGVQALIVKVQKQKEKLEAEKLRIKAMKKYEYEYDHVGWICGIDEAGRGPLAGPDRKSVV